MSETLPVVPFGGTDMSITRVGFGAFAIGGSGWAFGWGAQDDDASIRAILRSVELGVNWIDTAPVYGLGHAEEITAQAMKALPEADRPYIFTKAGLRWDDDNPMVPARRVGDPASIRWEVDQSLRRLEVERIDLYQMHWPGEDETTVEDYWPVFANLIDTGKVRAIGLSNHGVPALDACEAIRHVNSLQPPFNMLRRGAAADVLPWCAEHGTGSIVYSPMASGILTGSYTKEKAAALADDDWRSRSDAFQGETLERNLALVERLRPIAVAHDTTVGAVAVAWTLTFPGVTGAIVGARSPDQVDGWIPAATLALSDQELATVRTALMDLKAGDGPLEPVV
ncbi:MAG: aldo/keto reductase [Demequinaceae bacterium]|nr:aldo/keto reductase [Demequinaceae bacterium]